MSIYEFADIIGRDLLVTRFANQEERWTCQFASCEIKGDGVLIGEYGDAKSAIGAIQSYTQKIRGKILVFDACTEKRMEYNVPSIIKSPNNN